MVHNTFGFEVEFETPDYGGKCWGNFVCLSPIYQVRLEQWRYLQDHRPNWGNKWFLGEDLNDIRKSEKKSGRGERRRTEGSCRQFRSFIDNMEMGEINFKGRQWTWANNRENESYVEKRLDRFFASPDRLLLWPQVMVSHVAKQSSDHSLLILDSKPDIVKTKKRFYFDERFLEKVKTFTEIARA